MRNHTREGNLSSLKVEKNHPAARTDDLDRSNLVHLPMIGDYKGETADHRIAVNAICGVHAC
jgi:hypothetical protein